MTSTIRRTITLLFLIVFSLSLDAQQNKDNSKEINDPGLNLYFPPLTGDGWDTLSPSELNWCPQKIDSLYDFLEMNLTKGFILLQDGKIVLEKYFNGHDAESVWYWASAGKSLTSFLVGLAHEKGYLSLDDSVSHYLGTGWTSCSPEQEGNITIRHQITMTSGLDDDVTDPYCTEPSCLQYLAEPGSRWAYHNAPYTLLDSVLYYSTGQSINQLMNQWVKPLTGMTGAFLPVDYNNLYFSTLRSMARYGLLILNQGKWDTSVLMQDTSYFYAMTHPSQALNPSYGYLWWLNSGGGYLVPGSQFMFPGSILPDAPADLIAALGKNGQFINVIPSRNWVWVRMGEEPQSSLVPYQLDNQIWQYINELACGVGISEESSLDESECLVFPNPASENIQIQVNKPISVIQILDYMGRIWHSEPGQAGWNTVSLANLPAGCYQLRLLHDEEMIYLQKLIKI